MLGRTSATTAVGGLSAVCRRQQQCWGGPAPPLLCAMQEASRVVNDDVGHPEPLCRQV